jgi:hypothetical protein
VTYNLALTILEQEVEHEEDLQSLKEDLELMVERGSRQARDEASRGGRGARRCVCRWSGEPGLAVRIAKRSRSAVPEGAELVNGDAASPEFCLEAARGAAVTPGEERIGPSLTRRRGARTATGLRRLP